MCSSFIFCLLAMYYIATANATSCPMGMDIPGVPCRRLCQVSYEGYDLIAKDPGTQCTMPGGKPGECKNGECRKK
uniref:Putative salivary kunitz domain protein n=1 Tax=Ixodes ricinus TaxID=34613 RepID=A0A0K8R4F5_IXORI